MIVEKKALARIRKWMLPGPVPALCGTAAAQPQPQELSSRASVDKPITTTAGKFYCKLDALGLAGRAMHLKLTGKLIALHSKVVETDTGYEFQFDPAKVSLAELASWVAAESKCCPFFDFHIDLERAGRLLCLRLTGEDGVKAFIASEFQVPAK